MSAVGQDSLLLELERADELDPVLDWASVFGNDRAVEIEIGIGKGRFLLASAQRRPETNFLGIEWAAKYLRIAQARGMKRGLCNLRLARVDAREFIEFFVPAESVQALHLLFPDPWPKKRHHKRRLVNLAFLTEVERILAPEGRWWLATDHQEYFEVMHEVLSASRVLKEVAVEWEGTKTNYEEKYLARGKPIFRRVVQKMDSPRELE